MEKRCKDCKSYNIDVFEECQMGGCKEPARFQETTNMNYCVKHMKGKIHNTGTYALQFCPGCYRGLETHDKFCKYCGHSLKDALVSGDEQ